MTDVLGGSYKNVTSNYSDKHDFEAHHVYGYASYKTSLEFSRGDGPAIKMDKADHLETASWDHREGAKDYRTDQRTLLEQGKFGDAWMKDVDDIRTKFGEKYDQHLCQAEKHLLKLEQENKIHLETKFKQEIKARQEIHEKLEHKQKELEILEATKNFEIKQEFENKIQKEIEQHKNKLAESYKNKQAEYKELTSQNYEFKRTEAVYLKLNLSNDSGENKTLIYKFQHGDGRPELTQELKQKLWELKDGSIITRKQIEEIQQRIEVQTKPVEQASQNMQQVYNYKL